MVNVGWWCGRAKFDINFQFNWLWSDNIKNWLSREHKEWTGQVVLYRQRGTWLDHWIVQQNVWSLNIDLVTYLQGARPLLAKLEFYHWCYLNQSEIPTWVAGPYDDTQGWWVEWVQVGAVTAVMPFPVSSNNTSMLEYQWMYLQRLSPMLPWRLTSPLTIINDSKAEAHTLLQSPLLNMPVILTTWGYFRSKHQYDQKEDISTF